MRGRSLLIWVLEIGLVAMSTTAGAAAGDLDTTFSDDGMKLVAGVTVAASTVQADGKIVIVGVVDATARPVAMRYTTSGVLDTTFEGDGRATLRIPSPRGLALQADGRIVVTGHVGPGEVFGSEIAVERLTATGRRDLTFSGDGWAVTHLTDPWEGDYPVITGIAIDSLGRITVAVDSLEYPNDIDTDVSLLLQWDPSGARRWSFGNGGVAWARRCEGVSDLAVQADRKLVVIGRGSTIDPIVGPYGGDPCVTRLNPNGTLDGAFGTNGYTPFPGPPGWWPASVAVSPTTGAIMLSFTDDHLGATLVARTMSDGSPDPSFGAAGTTTIGLAGSRPDLALQGNKVVVVGSSRPGTSDQQPAWTVARLTGTGRPDATFGGDGVVTLDVGPGEDSARGVTVRLGKIVVTGSTSQGSAIARFQG